jgi:hypothetical protein
LSTLEPLDTFQRMKLVFLFAFSLLLLTPLLWGQEIDIKKLDPKMTREKADEKGIAWFDPRTPPFRLVGFPWIGNVKVYRNGRFVAPSTASRTRLRAAKSTSNLIVPKFCSA